MSYYNFGHNKREDSNNIKKFFNVFIKLRYFIALIIFIVLVAFKINGSSIGIWNNYIEGGKTSIVAGKARSIRSDEWEVLLPIYMSQSNSSIPFQVDNSSVTTSGQNVLITMGAPIRDIYSIAKPLHWGILFLGLEYGISWYWNLKIILIILLSFELCMIITKENRLVSVLGTFWIAFSPAVQWWFVQHVGDNVLYFEAIVVSFYYMLKYFNRIGLKVLFTVLFALSCVGYVTPLYPPLQVSFGFLSIIIMVLIFTDFKEKIKIKKLDIFILVGAVIFIVIMLFHLYMLMKDAFSLMNNTVYPGKRATNGGGAYPYGLVGYLTNVFIPYERLDGLWTGLSGVVNQCELSSFYNFLPMILLALPLFIIRRYKCKAFKYGIAFLFFSIFFAIYAYYPILPYSVARITMLSYVTGVRAILAYTFSAMLLSIWAFAEMMRIGRAKRRFASIVSVIVFIFYFVSLRSLGIDDYRLKYYIVVILVITLLGYLLLRVHKYAFSSIMLILILISGITVNPINLGITTLTKSKLSIEIQQVKSKDPDANWMPVSDDVSGALGVLAYSNGVKSLGGINNYPDYKKWLAIDPKKQYANIYNRSAHITFSVVNTKTNFKLVTYSVFKVNINVDDIEKLNVKYIITNENLDNYNNGNVTFKQLFSRDSKNNTIYEVNYNK